MNKTTDREVQVGEVVKGTKGNYLGTVSRVRDELVYCDTDYEVDEGEVEWTGTYWEVSEEWEDSVEAYESCY